MSNAAYEFQELLEIIAALRHPEKGCPWDREQTHESLKSYMIEEAYELTDAIDHEPDKICEELGDVLLQVLLHSQIASERDEFDITRVMERLARKLVHRHPHVFGDAAAKDADQVVEKWQQLKRKETGKGLLDGIPRALPALLRAEKMGGRALRAGAGRADLAESLERSRSLLDEFIRTAEADKAGAGRVLATLLFTLVQSARMIDAEAEDLLHQECGRFAARYRAVEGDHEEGVKALSAKELAQLWEGKE